MVAKILISKEDLSVNFVEPTGVEARYVRRSGKDAIIVYLSSHTGCNQACRFCHLTQTGQTAFAPTTVQGFLSQADEVLRYYRTQVDAGLEAPVRRVNFNWMARGEPLLNTELLSRWGVLSSMLEALALAAGLQEVRFKVSTILPVGSGEFHVGDHPPELYYSLYSLNPAFRRRWLPKAMDPALALEHLRRHQDLGGKVVLHWALIEGENDSEADVSEIARWVERSRLRARFNLVRYNPYSSKLGKEPPEDVLHARFAQLASAMQIPGSKIVSRVGHDVKASCGMFVDLYDPSIAA